MCAAAMENASNLQGMNISKKHTCSCLYLVYVNDCCGNASGSFLEELLLELALEVLALVKTVLVVNKKNCGAFTQEGFCKNQQSGIFLLLGYVRKFNAFIDLLPRVITYCTWILWFMHAWLSVLGKSQCFLLLKLYLLSKWTSPWGLRVSVSILKWYWAAVCKALLAKNGSCILGKTFLVMCRK